MSMARVIDADSLFRRTSKEMDCRKLYLPVDFQELVATEPTVDAEPVRHGRWVIMRDRTLECSECKSIAPFEADRNGDVVFADEYDYCPHCGAKMDGGENDGKA